LRDSIRIALQRNLTIRLADLDLETAESGRAQALAEILPKLSTLRDYTPQSEAPSIELPADFSAVLRLPSSISTEMVEAEALLTQARTHYFNAIYDHHLAAFALQKATGVILE